MRNRLLTVLALALAGVLTGCGSSDPSPRSMIEHVASPGAGWKSGGHGIDQFGSKKMTRAGGIWVADSAYFAGWEVVVLPGHEGERCEQAARWMKKTGSGYTGTPADPGAKTSTLVETVQACLAALKPQDQGSSTTIGFAHWPEQSSDDFALHADIGATVTGSEMRLYAAANAVRYG